MNKTPLALAVCAFILSACASDGAFRDRAGDYRRAKLTEPLSLPEGVSGASLGDSFRVPGIESHIVLPGNFEVPKPDPLLKDIEQGVVRVQRLGEQSWILVTGTPGQIWPRLRGFLSVAGFNVAHTDAVNGIIETVWLQPRGNELPRERYRFRIEQGVQRGSSEIFVLQNAVESDKGWPARSFNQEREKEMQMALAQYLADSEAASSVSMLAQQNVDAQGKVFYRQDDSDQYLLLKLGFERGWASLGLALQKAGFEIKDLNHSEGRYWVSPAAEDKGGWMRRLFADRDAQQSARYIVSLLNSADGELQIRIVAEEGSELTDSQAEKMLKRIKGYLT